MSDIFLQNNTLEQQNSCRQPQRGHPTCYGTNQDVRVEVMIL